MIMGLIGVVKITSMRSLITAAVLTLAVPIGVTSAQAKNARDHYEGTAFIGGFILRASMVCADLGYDWKTMSVTAQDLLSSGDMRAITNAYPKAVEAWMARGGGTFNNGVMTSGAAAACKVAWQDVLTARSPTSAPKVAKSSCELLWDAFDRADALMKQEKDKPGFTPAYRAATHQGELICREIVKERCPVKDPATTEQMCEEMHLLNQMQKDAEQSQ
jgi:hypothetical protein